MRTVLQAVVLLVVMVQTTDESSLPTEPRRPICSANRSSKVRLLDRHGKPVYTSGRLEMRKGNNWFTLCTVDFYSATAKLVCDALCESGTTPLALGGGDGEDVHPDAVIDCPSSAKDIKECSMHMISSESGDMRNICTKQNTVHVVCKKEEKVLPVESTAFVQCKNKIATVSMMESAMPGVTVSTILLQNINKSEPNCLNVNRTKSSVVVKFPYTRCGGTQRFRGDMAIFNHILVVVFPSTNGIIQNTNATVNVSCQLTKSSLASSYRVIGIGQKYKVTSVDNPNVFIEAFKDEEMTKPIMPGQKIIISQYSTIYARIYDKSPDPDSVMALRSCWLTPDKTSGKKLNLVVNGCINPNMVRRMHYKSNKEQIMVFRPALFIGYHFFNLHCKVKTCPYERRYELRCSRYCTNLHAFENIRRKRSGDLSEASTKRGIGSKTVTS